MGAVVMTLHAGQLLGVIFLHTPDARDVAQSESLQSRLRTSICKVQ